MLAYELAYHLTDLINEQREIADAADDLLEAYGAQRPQSPGPFRDEQGNVFAVVKGRQSGNFYAKAWNGRGWEYAQGAIYSLRESMRMTLDEAIAFGHLTGQCCICGAYLTDEKSVALGIGPVCGARVYGKEAMKALRKAAAPRKGVAA